jgi:hypothetical protein
MTEVFPQVVITHCLLRKSARKKASYETDKDGPGKSRATLGEIRRDACLIKKDRQNFQLTPKQPPYLHNNNASKLITPSSGRKVCFQVLLVSSYPVPSQYGAIESLDLFQQVSGWYGLLSSYLYFRKFPVIQEE